MRHAVHGDGAEDLAGEAWRTYICRRAEHAAHAKIAAADDDTVELAAGNFGSAGMVKGSIEFAAADRSLVGDFGTKRTAGDRAVVGD